MPALEMGRGVRIVLLGTNRSKPKLNVQKGTGVQIRTPEQEPRC